MTCSYKDSKTIRTSELPPWRSEEFPCRHQFRHRASGRVGSPGGSRSLQGTAKALRDAIVKVRCGSRILDSGWTKADSGFLEVCV